MKTTATGPGAQVLALAVHKGGTGKTTTAAALAQAAAYKGRKVLAIDLDPQANLTYILGAEPSRGRSALEAPAAELIQHRAGVDIIPASMTLATASSSKGSARRLQKALEPIKENYNLIVIDTPATTGELQYNAMQAATGLIIPLQADIFCLQGLYQMADTAAAIQQSNPALAIKGFILTQYDTRSTIARQMQQTITEQAAARGVPYLGAIRSGVVVKEAAALQKSLFEYAPKSKPANDYLTLFDALKL